MLNLLKSFHQEESGQDLIEYAIIAAMLVAGGSAVFQPMINGLTTEFKNISTSLANIT
jgi:Flp pilus assembly pilin Flp